MLEHTSITSYTELPEIKIFFNYIDLYQNYAIAKYLKNHEQELGFRFSLSGTVYDHESLRISEFKKQMSECLFKTLSNFIERIIENDYIIYDISQDPTEIREIEKVLDSLKKVCENDFENKLKIKYLILLSIPLTWGKTEARNNESILYESEYRRRRPHPSYIRHKNIERRVNLLEKDVHSKVRTLIICPGYTFGESNDIFNYIFKLAYFNKQIVPIVAPGHQIIPIIYINDLARIIGDIIKNFPPPEKRYIFAVQPNFWTIKSFTRAIVNGVTGNIVRVSVMPQNCLMKYEKDYFPERVFDAITTPLKFKSCYLKDFKYTFMNIEEIGKILINEYRIARNLSPLKILIDGPPLSGKTIIAKELAKYYNINYIDPAIAVRLVKKRLEKDVDIANKLLFNLEREKVQIENEEDNEVQYLEENIKDLIEKWQDYLIDLTNHDSNERKCYDEILKYQIKCLKKIISSKSYSENQGYVIDGFPFTYNQASEIFFDSDFDENKDEENVEKNKYKTHISDDKFEEQPFKNFRTSAMMPNFVILLDISEKLVCQRGMHLPLEEVFKTGNNEESICQRLEEFRKRDEHEDTNLTNFFYDCNVIPMCIVIDENTEYNLLIDTIKEKIGSPHTLPLTPMQKCKIKNAELNEKKKVNEDFERKQKEIAAKIQAEREAKLRQWTKEFETLKREEDLATEAKSLPFRQYLAKFVLPTLTEGILEVARVKPNDPVDYLAEFLFKNNNIGNVLSDQHAEEMKRLLLDEGKESVLKFLDNYVLNENEFNCTSFDESSSSKR